MVQRVVKSYVLKRKSSEEDDDASESSISVSVISTDRVTMKNIVHARSIM